MIFDSNVSDSVSLSKILDCFIIDDEKPSVILNFLSQYQIDDLINILYYSLYSTRIFQLDFLGKCSYKDIENLIDITRKFYINSFNPPLQLSFVWKVLQSNSSSEIKNKFRELLSTFRSMAQSRHPYSGSYGTVMSHFENIFKDINTTPEQMADYISSLEDSKVESYFKNISHSLFFDRILEEDVFSMLDFKKQYIIISTLNKSYYQLDFRFIKKMLEQKIDIDLKYMIYSNAFDFRITLAPSDINIHKIINESESYPELAMKMSLYGIDETAREIIPHLLMSHPDLLFEMYREDKDIIKNNYDITDLIEKIMEKNGSR